MSTVHRGADGSHLVYVKGAPELLLDAAPTGRGPMAGSL